MSDSEFIDWWNGCRWDKTDKCRDLWPRQKLAELERLRDLIEQAASATTLYDVHTLLHGALTAPDSTTPRS